MEAPLSVNWEKYPQGSLIVPRGTLASAISVGHVSGTTIRTHQGARTGLPTSATHATRVVICERLLLVPEKWGILSVLTVGQPSLRIERNGGGILRLDAVLSVLLEVGAEPLMPVQEFRERRGATVGMRPRRGSICRPCEASPTGMATFFKEPRRGWPSSVLPMNSGEKLEVLQETENLQPGRELPRG